MILDDEQHIYILKPKKGGGKGEGKHGVSGGGMANARGDSHTHPQDNCDSSSSDFGSFCSSPFSFWVNRKSCFHWTKHHNETTRHTMGGPISEQSNYELPRFMSNQQFVRAISVFVTTKENNQIGSVTHIIVVVL